MTDNVIAEVTSPAERNVSLRIVLLSLLLIICFFLPWLSILGIPLSGFEIYRRRNLEYGDDFS
jgi:hypothetical protein